MEKEVDGPLWLVAGLRGWGHGLWVWLTIWFSKLKRSNGAVTVSRVTRKELSITLCIWVREDWCLEGGPLSHDAPLHLPRSICMSLTHTHTHTYKYVGLSSHHKQHLKWNTWEQFAVFWLVHLFHEGRTHHDPGCVCVFSFYEALEEGRERV